MKLIALLLVLTSSCARPERPSTLRCVAILDDGIAEDAFLSKKEEQTSDPDNRKAFEMVREMVLQRISTQMSMFQCVP